MTNLNVETYELTIDQLDKVTGGDGPARPRQEARLSMRRWRRRTEWDRPGHRPRKRPWRRGVGRWR
jgi:hypothetical protein